MSDIIDRLRRDAAMNLELPEVSHLQKSGQLENEAADVIDSLIAERDRLRAEVAECKKDAERYRWLRNNISYYDVDADWPVEGANIPALAQVSNRIWYHATDDVTHNTLDEAVDTALGGEGK